jgi:predicted deacylase
MEGPIGSEYERHRKWLIKFGDQNVNWNDYTKAGEATAYIASHEADIDMVIKVEGMVAQLNAMTLKEYEDLMEILGKPNSPNKF